MASRRKYSRIFNGYRDSGGVMVLETPASRRNGWPGSFYRDKIGQRRKDGHARLVWQRLLRLLHLVHRFRFEAGWTDP